MKALDRLFEGSGFKNAKTTLLPDSKDGCNYITTNKRQALIKAVYLTDIHDEVIICPLDYWKKIILSDDPTFIKVKNLEKQGIVLYNNMNKM